MLWQVPALLGHNHRKTKEVNVYHIIMCTDPPVWVFDCWDTSRKQSGKEQQTTWESSWTHIWISTATFGTSLNLLFTTWRTLSASVLFSPSPSASPVLAAASLAQDEELLNAVWVNLKRQHCSDGADLHQQSTEDMMDWNPSTNKLVLVSLLCHPRRKSLLDVTSSKVKYPRHW